MRKQFFVLCALLLTTIGASAQVDYSSYLANGTWSSSSTCPSLSSAHESYNGSGNNSAGKILYCTVSDLPAGTYTVSFYVAANAANVEGVTSGDNIAQAYVSVGGTVAATQAITVGTVTGMANSWSSGTLCTLSATLTNAGSIEFGIQNVAAGGNWYICEGKSLVCTSETLTEGDVAHYCVAWDDEWSITGNSGGLFQRNVWSTEGETSGMVTPFIEYWVGGSNNLSDAAISHTQIANLPEGYYTVSIDARAFNEGDETPVTTGTVLYYAKGDGDTQNVSVDLATGTDNLFNGHFEYYGTYSVIAHVSTSKTLDVGFTISGTNSDWVSWKNLKVTYLGTELSYNIGTGTADATYIKAGQEVTISFANCMSADEDAVLSATATGTLSDGTTTTTVTLTGDGNGNYTFTVPEGLTYSTTYTFTMATGAVTWTYGGETKFSSPAVSLTFTTPEMADITGVYLFNLGENEFLSRGHNNDNTTGTAADVDVYGLPVDITASSTGGWNIRYIDSNLYIGGEWWATANAELASAASFTLVEDGTTTDGRTIYRFRNGSSNSSAAGDLYVNNGTSHGPLGLNDDDAGINSEADRQWVIYSKDERDAFKAANLLAQHIAIAEGYNGTAVTSEEGFNSFIEGLYSEDVTSLVTDATLTNATFNGSTGGWTTTNSFTPSSNDYCTEVYQGDTDISQTVSGLEEGIYKITLQGFIRQGSAANCTTYSDQDLSIAFLCANGDYDTNLKTWASGRPTEEDYNTNYATAVASDPETWLQGGYELFPNSMYQAGLLLDDKAYQNELYALVSNGTLTIEIDCPDYLDAEWMIVKNLTLTRYYADDIYTNDVTWKLANPSFEVDNVVANLTADTNSGGTSRCTDDGDGAWIVESLTGWNLTKNSVSDLMSEKAAATDNNFGAPGKPADGTYMLYLRDAWASATDKVSQSVTLPAGNYKLTVDSKCVSGASGHSVQLTVGDIASANLTISSTMPSEWNTTSVTFSLDEETTLDVAVSVTYGGTGLSGLSVLLDNFKLYSTAEITEEISWEMTDAGWGTLILPFDATLDDGLTAYSCDGTEPSTDETTGEEITVVSLTAVEGGIVANTPYIIGGTAGTYSFSGVPTNEKEIYSDGLLTGTLVDLAVATGAAFATDGTMYLLQNHTEGDDPEGLAFYPIVEEESAEATLKAYHCYLTLTSGPSGARVYIGFPDSDETTAIVAVESEEAEGNGAIYDLSGRKVSKAVKGVYIQNGKKVLVK